MIYKKVFDILFLENYMNAFESMSSSQKDPETNHTPIFREGITMDESRGLELLKKDLRSNEFLLATTTPGTSEWKRAFSAYQTNVHQYETQTKKPYETQFAHPDKEPKKFEEQKEAYIKEIEDHYLNTFIPKTKNQAEDFKQHSENIKDTLLIQQLREELMQKKKTDGEPELELEEV